MKNLAPILALFALAVQLSYYGCGETTPPTHSKHSSSVTWIGRPQRIVSAMTPEGVAFSIVGQRYRFAGNTHLDIAARFADPWEVASGGDEGTWGGSRLLREEITVGAACRLTQFVIVHGLLTNSGDTVLARTGHKTVLLHRVALPPALHTKGSLVYLTASTSPTAFAVRTRGKKLVALTRTSQRHVFPGGCEGPEKAWVASHFIPALADDAVARISECQRGKGFEVGAPAEPVLGEAGRRRLREYIATRETCRKQIRAAMALVNTTEAPTPAPDTHR